MSRAYMAVTSRIFPLLALVCAVGAGYFAGTGEDTRPMRALMFAFVALVFAAELTSMVARTRWEQWDGLAISMGLVRFAVVHYFAMLAIEFGGYAHFPTGLWDISRTMLGVFGLLAFLFMVREDVRAYQEMTRVQRLQMTTLLVAFVSYFFLIQVIW